jgi:hypothetical protein
MKDTVTHSLSVIVRPRSEPIFSEMATIIEIVDEASGAYLEIHQPGGNVNKKGVCIDPEEWPEISKAIESMLAICEEYYK